jgi:HK97 family phage prohead protease
VELEQGNISSEFIVKSEGLKSNTVISGYASVFGVLDSYNDIIVKGAFNKVQGASVKLLWQHDALKPIGVIKSLYEDERGLKVEAEINNKISTGFEAAELVKQQAVKGLSIGFTIKSFDYNELGQRVISEVNLMEISIVTFPANNLAEIQQFKNQDLGCDRDQYSILRKIELSLEQLKTLRRI